jgi:signal transduction histidine kinase
MNKTQILIVEDDYSFADLVQFQLTTVGFKSEFILAIASIEEAKEAALEFIPEVILLDLNILDSNGISTYDSITSIFPHASIIVLSGLDDKSVALRIVSKGAQDYILKSDVKPELLEKTINYSWLRKKLKVELEDSEKKYRDVFYKSPMPMFKLRGESLVIEMANQSSHDLYKVPNSGFDGLSFYEFNSIGNTPFTNLNSESSFRKEFIQETLTGEEKTVEVILNKLDSVDEIMFIAHIIDRTEELEFERKKYEIISQAEENEKKKIARELHDGLGQNMVLLNLLYQSVTPQSDQQNKFEEIGHLIQNCIRELKEIAYNLLPPELDHGFLNAIDRFAHRVNSIGTLDFIVDIQTDFSEEDLINIDKFNLYRIVQEFINNSIKHASAKTVKFKIEKVFNDIILCISDDGIGFDEENIRKGLGIQNVQHRIKIANIKGELKSTLGNGAELRLVINRF